MRVMCSLSLRSPTADQQGQTLTSTTRSTTRRGHATMANTCREAGVAVALISPARRRGRVFILNLSISGAGTHGCAVARSSLASGHLGPFAFLIIFPRLEKTLIIEYLEKYILNNQPSSGITYHLIKYLRRNPYQTFLGPSPTHL